MGGVGLLVEGPIVYVSSGVKGVLVGSGLVFFFDFRRTISCK